MTRDSSAPRRSPQGEEQRKPQVKFVGFGLRRSYAVIAADGRELGNVKTEAEARALAAFEQVEQ